MVMNILVSGCLYHPDQTIFFLPPSMSSFEMERYGMTNGSCPLVFCLQKPCRRFKYSLTVVRGSKNKSATDRKYLLKPFAVGFFGTSRERERGIVVYGQSKPILQLVLAKLQRINNKKNIVYKASFTLYI